MSDSDNSGGGCSCVGLVLFILIFWAMFFGLPVDGHKYNIDIFPPRIWDMNKAERTMEAAPAPPQPESQ